MVRTEEEERMGDGDGNGNGNGNEYGSGVEGTVTVDGSRCLL